ncbi:MAG: response regulator transcription factor [Vicinamibacterales bacterium]
MTTRATILIVEDDPAIRHVLVEALSDEGYRIVETANGQDALAALASPDVVPNAIILDLMMPVMDGWAFRAEQIQAGLATDIPLIVLSASRRATPSAADLVAAAIIPKPFDLEELLATVRAAVGRR